MADFVRVASTSDIPAGKGKRFTVNGKQVAVFNLDGKFHAIEALCPHRGGPLDEGPISGAKVTCPWHGSVFDIPSGKLEQGPSSRGVQSFEVKISGKDLMVKA
jgi:nitrite reductase/ring-hydroxylating ferredoxin subunit